MHTHSLAEHDAPVLRLAYLGDTLSALSPAENSPRDAAGVLALEEERLGLAILEAEDLAVAPDEELALFRFPCQLGILLSSRAAQSAASVSSCMCPAGDVRRLNSRQCVSLAPQL